MGQDLFDALHQAATGVHWEQTPAGWSSGKKKHVSHVSHVSPRFLWITLCLVSAVSWVLRDAIQKFKTLGQQP